MKRKRAKAKVKLKIKIGISKYANALWNLIIEHKTNSNFKNNSKIYPFFLKASISVFNKKHENTSIM